MKTITVRLENDRDAELLKKIIQHTKFEDKIETAEEEDEWSLEEFKMLDDLCYNTSQDKIDLMLAKNKLFFPDFDIDEWRRNQNS